MASRASLRTSTPLTSLARSRSDRRCTPVSRTQGNGIQVDDGSPIPRGLDQVADQIDRSELGILHAEDRRVREEVEHGPTLHGPRHVSLDHPEELIEACERITPFMVKSGVASCKAAGHIMPFIPLHKGADGFMSDDQFLKFYWPTLRKLIIWLVNEGCVPQLFAEGKYNQRLESICDVPKGKTVWWFDMTDMKRAEEMFP